MIRPISPSMAQDLCDEYAQKWGTGKHTPDSSAYWVGEFHKTTLVGAIGWVDDSNLKRRHVLSWHVAPGRHGTLAARDLLAYAHSSLPARWLMIGTVTPQNEAARAFLTKEGYSETAVIFTRAK